MWGRLPLLSNLNLSDYSKMYRCFVLMYNFSDKKISTNGKNKNYLPHSNLKFRLH